jgi:hypothetical protein
VTCVNDKGVQRAQNLRPLSLLYGAKYFFDKYRFLHELVLYSRPKYFQMEKLKDLYIRTFGEEPVAVVRLTGDGSNRVYYRMTGVSDAIAAVGTSVEENRAFIALSRAMQACDVAVPAVLAVSDDELSYIQDDL